VKPVADQEYYELRIYKIFDYDKQNAAEDHLENALLPALNRMGLDRIGVFTNDSDENDHSVYVLIPFPTINQFLEWNRTLAADEEYQAAAASYFACDKNDPIYERIESRLLKAFAGMPVMEVPAVSVEKKPRIFELRIYESHTEDHARRKVKMFNEGLTQIMRDTGLAPLFFGETLSGPDVPSLAYMLSAESVEAHEQHFDVFRVNADWKRVRAIKEYRGTVSNIDSRILTPTDYSQI
jgi:hypothetical protein